jgi:hypothetical protein
VTGTWQELAEQKRAAEDQVIARHRWGLFKGEMPAADRGYPTRETPWGLGRQFFSGLYVTRLSRRSAWPETQMVWDLFWENFPDRHFIAFDPLWPPSCWDDPEPPYEEFADVHLVEGIHEHGRRWLAVQPGPVVYFIWQVHADARAPGAPPAELLRAREEIDRIKASWSRPV